MAHGGAGLVAVFTAVNGIAGFGECVTLGAPVAGAAMLGVFSGEKDNGSCRLLLKEEWKTGCITGIVFLLLCVGLNGPVMRMCGLREPILVPLLWMALFVFPALLLNILTTYYNMAGRDLWANGLIFLRLIAFTCLGLVLTLNLHFSAFFFLLFAELAALVFWFVGTALHLRRHLRDSRFLMNDLENEKNGRLLNFSVSAEVNEIVSASERISEFCAANAMSVKQTMRLQIVLKEGE